MKGWVFLLISFLAISFLAIVDIQTVNSGQTATRAAQ
jgi:hypothetical protein